MDKHYRYFVTPPAEEDYDYDQDCDKDAGLPAVRQASRPLSLAADDRD